ncbi:MAG: site-specific integrase [Bacteroidota bacterium]|nr:site-specific integrase [Bacteroidota bacterium]
MTNLFAEELKGKVILTPEYVSQIVKNKILLENNNVDFFKHYDEMMESIRINTTPNNIKNYKQLHSILKGFEAETNYNLTFGTVNQPVFFDKFLKYCIKVKGFTNNTISGYIGKFKSFMNWATKRGYNSEQAYKEYNVKEYEVTHIALTPEEFKTLYFHDFRNYKLNKAKDLFCFMVSTGYRISDLKDLKPEHIQADCIEKVIVKTKERIKIPLNQYSKVLLAKYGSLINIRISEQKLNDYIKECCEILNFDTPVEIVKYQGAKQIIETKPKYECITNHVARKTFATLMLNQGMAAYDIMKITGHKKETTFRKYVGINDEQHNKKMIEAWGKI